MNSSNNTCLLCLENHNNSFEICGKIGNLLHAGTILLEHFWFEASAFAGRKICEKCWGKVKTFHIFHNFVKSIHQTRETIATTDNEFVCNEEEPMDIKDIPHVFSEIAETSNAPAPRCDELEVVSGTTKGPATVANETRNLDSELTILAALAISDSHAAECEKKLKCVYCHRLYGYGTNLHAHILQRHQARCPFCPRKFIRKETTPTIRRHIARKHKHEIELLAVHKVRTPTTSLFNALSLEEKPTTSN